MQSEKVGFDGPRFTHHVHIVRQFANGPIYSCFGEFRFPLCQFEKFDCDLWRIVTAGSTPEEAMRLATEALAFHVQGMIEDGEKLPAPRSLKQIQAAKEDWVDFDGAVVTMVALLPAPEGKPQPTNLSLDPGLVRSVDRYAEKMNMTRSMAFAEGAKLLMTVRPAAEKHVIRRGADGKLRIEGPRRLLRAAKKKA